MDQRERVLEACFECVARFGMGKTTVDDVAKLSGISRATIYRLFPGGKDQLLRETVGWEMNRFFARLGEQVFTAPDFATLLEEALVYAHRAMREHQVLQKVLETEPERLLPLLTVEQHRVSRAVAQFLLPYVEREQREGRLAPGVDPEHAADFVARMALSLIASPGADDLEDPDVVRSLVRDRLLAGVVANPRV